MAYEKEFEGTRRAEVFRHKRHSFEQDLDCTVCHDNREVNTRGHGTLKIKEENCLKCHHVELKETECKRCHQNIDVNPMKYKEEKFIHGFTVESDVNCGLCHVKDSNASIKDEEINCVKCHHTTPDLDCVKCHRDVLDQFSNPNPLRKSSLSWTVSFKHSHHPVEDISCEKCHVISQKNESGIVEYSLNCSKCHHDSEINVGCIECHKEPFAYLMGEIGVKEITTIPDMMSRVVKCEDCHKYDGERSQFREGEEYCIECHNKDYGRLYNAWTETIRERLKGFNHRIQDLVEDSNNTFLNGLTINEGKDIAVEEKSVLDTFINEAGLTVDLITKYGTHNFNLTRTLLDYLEEKIK